MGEYCSTPPRVDEDPEAQRQTVAANLATADIALSAEKKNDSSSQSIKAPLQQDEIEYRYLTFDTELPSPSFRHAAQPSEATTASQSQPPECPDLRPYTSPFQWSYARKTFITCLATSCTALSASSAGSYSPPQDVLMAKWMVSDVVYNIGLTVYCLGFGIAPMVLAPFSEINGRRPLFLSSGVIFMVCQIGSGATNSFAGMLLSRFFLGVGGSTFSTVVGGVVSDIYHAEDRNTPMALFSAAAMFGTGLGPLFSGFVVHRTSWSWVFYSQAIGAAVVLVLSYFFFNETRGSVLLSRKAKVLNKWYESLEEAGHGGVDIPVSDHDGMKIQSRRLRWKVRSDEERESLAKMISISLYRPFHLLITEPVVFFFSLWVSFAWGVLFLQFGSIASMFTEIFNFNTEQAGATFAAMCVASIIALIASIWHDKIAERFGKATSTPEGRLRFVCVASILLPAGLFWFGWSSFPSLPWIVPTLAVGCSTIGIFTIYLATFNYLADVYHRYASSALAAQSFCRNMFGAIFPLVTPALFNNLGYPVASSLLGAIAALLTAVPWVLLFFGPQIRARSKIASMSGLYLGKSWFR